MPRMGVCNGGGLSHHCDGKRWCESPPPLHTPILGISTGQPGAVSEHRVLGEHLAVQLTQLRAGIDAELLGYQGAGSLVGRERIALPAAVKEAVHEQGPQALAEGMLTQRRAVAPRAGAPRPLRRGLTRSPRRPTPGTARVRRPASQPPPPRGRHTDGGAHPHSRGPFSVCRWVLSRGPYAIPGLVYR